MEGVESVVVGDHDVCAALQQQSQHVVPFLGDGVVQRGVALGILPKRIMRGLRLDTHKKKHFPLDVKRRLSRICRREVDLIRANGMRTTRVTATLPTDKKVNSIGAPVHQPAAAHFVSDERRTGVKEEEEEEERREGRASTRKRK